MKRITASLLAAAMAAGVSSAAIAADELKQENRFLDVIVKLNVDARFQGPENSRAMAADVARSHGAQAAHLYGSVFSGFSARVTETSYKRLLSDPMVEYVSSAAVAVAAAVAAVRSCPGALIGPALRSTPTPARAWTSTSSTPASMSTTWI